jgi:nicotinamidase-related amidase
MTEHVWDDLLTEQDRTVISQGGFDTTGASAAWESRGLGDKPVLMVIDVQKKNAGPNEPIVDAMQESGSATAMGKIAWDAVEHIERLLAVARANDVPVIYTRSVPPAYDDPDNPELDIVEPIAPEEDDPVLDKSYASPFYRTDILTRLVDQGIDTVITTGGSTSGCIRATVVDAQSHGFNVVVPQEAVFDRIRTSHLTGLLDIWMKYGEVMERREVEEYLRSGVK